MPLNKLKTLESLVKSADGRKLMDDTKLVMWLNENSAVDEIIYRIEELIEMKCLEKEILDDNGIRLIYNQKSIQIADSNGEINLNKLLAAINELLHPDYEIRFWKGSYGMTDLAFIPLAKELWDALEEHLSTSLVNEEFRRVEFDTQLFYLDSVSVQKYLDEYLKFKSLF